jgi:4-hydroxyacetophenone monooxygenase
MKARQSAASNLDETSGAEEALIFRALEQADPNVLRLALYQLTGDPTLAEMKTERANFWGGALFSYALAPEHHAGVRQKALEVLRSGNSDAGSVADVRKTMELFGHGPLTDKDFNFGYEEAAFDEMPREVQWTSKPAQSVLDNLHVLVIGAGISGIAAAVQLQRLGITYTVVDRQNDLGGTWNLNTYPGARVDSTSHIYQFKFEKRYPWTKAFATHDETKSYLRHCAEKFGIFGNIIFRTEVTEARWDDAESKWNIVLRSVDGTRQTVTANFIISASGLFSTPRLPDIPGLESFEGRAFHTTGWDHSFDYRGKRVAMIGTGSTGVQLMPQLAASVAAMKVFQRTPNWIMPIEGYDSDVTAETRWLFENVPYYWNWFMYAMHFLNIQLEGLQAFDPEWIKSGGVVNHRNDEMRITVTKFIEEKLASRPDLIEKVLPNYPPMARRPVVDHKWYDALMRDNVELVTDGIERITPKGILTKTGKTYELDLIVFAVGFSVAKYMWPVKYTGRNNVTLDQLWAKDGPRAYLAGMTMPGLPNLFLFYGPNGQARGGSFYSMAELWTRYAVKSILKVIETGHTSIEVRREAFEDYNLRVDEASEGMLWQTYGKGFYYVSKEGRNLVNAPWNLADYHAMLIEPAFKDFIIQ